MTSPRAPSHAEAVDMVAIGMERVNGQNPSAAISDWAGRCFAATWIASQALLSANIEHGLAVGGYRIRAEALGKPCDFVLEVTKATLEKELQCFDLDRVACHTWVVLPDGDPLDPSVLATVGPRLLPAFKPHGSAWRDHVFSAKHPAYDFISLTTLWKAEVAVMYHYKTVAAELAFALDAREVADQPGAAEASLALAWSRLRWIHLLALRTAPRVAGVIETVHPQLK